ncbi:hypothetical protein M0811_00139 [Anaeramoeba ignava]|uniref:Uncharacterized protein n=1 Tax=Anaeramoeba ignava TaxID=1746090 RepID=A0A9Q0LPY1_ANAIG|nr:hypothetical protein M0811_00139 [Anaeramoeba ignava]
MSQNNLKPQLFICYKQRKKDKNKITFKCNEKEMIQSNQNQNIWIFKDESNEKTLKEWSIEMKKQKIKTKHQKRSQPIKKTFPFEKTQSNLNFFIFTEKEKKSKSQKGNENEKEIIASEFLIVLIIQFEENIFGNQNQNQNQIESESESESDIEFGNQNSNQNQIEIQSSFTQIIKVHETIMEQFLKSKIMKNILKTYFLQQFII